MVILPQTVQEICSREAVDAPFSAVFLHFGNYQPEVVSDVISGTIDQDVSVDVWANCGDSRLKPSEASFSAPF